MFLSKGERAPMKRCILSKLTPVIGTPRAEERWSLIWLPVCFQEGVERVDRFREAHRLIDIFLADRGELTAELAQDRVSYRTNKALKLSARFKCSALHE